MKTALFLKDISKIIRLFAIVLALLLIFGFYKITSLVKIKKTQDSFNLILISVDTLRADRLGIYGYEQQTSPSLDQWAKKGVVFTNAYTAIPFTYPSFASLMTGVDPFKSHIFNNFKNNMKVPDDKKTIAEILKDNKFVTGAFFTNFVLLNKNSNLKKGFDIYKYNKAWNSRDEGYTNLVKDSMDWMEGIKNNRFFLWVHFSDPHIPYDPPDDLKCKFNSAECSATNDLKTVRSIEEKIFYNGCQEIDPKSIDILNAVYDGEVGQVDRMINNIFNKLQSLDLTKKTVVVFIGDHGEGFDHNYFTHGKSLYNSSVRIPLIIYYPLSSGKIDHRLIDNTDFMPTILSLLNITFDPSRIDGIDFSDSFLTESLFKKNTEKRKNVYLLTNDVSKYGIIEDSFKYILSSTNACLFRDAGEELYDLNEDPQETKNLVGDKKDLRNKLKKKISDYVEINKLPKETEKEQDLDSETLEKMKTLGY